MNAVIRFLVVWSAGLALLIVLDFIFLGYLASGFFQHHLAPFLDIVDGNMNVHVPAAIATWAVLVGGIYLFVLPRAAATGGAGHALLWGALYGFVVYGVYDLTNLATLKDWPFIVTVVDMTWGACVCAIVALWMYFVNAKLPRGTGSD